MEISCCFAKQVNWDDGATPASTAEDSLSFDLYSLYVELSPSSSIR
jgi:hypothetical protein